MITTISESGTLTIRPLTELESFALQQWVKSYQNDEGCGLEVLTLKEDLPSMVSSPNKPNPFNNAVDFNEDRLSKDGKSIIPSDPDVLSVLKTNGIPMLPIEIAKAIEEIKEKEVKIHSVYNSLQRLLSSERVDKDKYNGIVMWIALEDVERPKIKPRPEVISDAQRLVFTKEQGYNTIDEAVTDMGSWNFEDKLKEWNNSLIQ